MAVPKRKKSKRAIRTRKSAHRAAMTAPKPVKCPNCGAARLAHRACPSCGYYKGRQVVTIEAD